MRGEKASFLAVVIILIAISAYLSYSGNQAIAAAPPEICKISGEVWDYAANANFPPFDCCTGLIACSDGYCCEAGATESVVTGQIAGMAISQPVKEFIAPSPEPVGIEYECYTNPDCGTGAWVGSPYCQNNDVYQSYRTYTCENPGTPFASCVQSDQEKRKQDCGDGVDGGWTAYCKDNSVWESRTITEKGCLDGYCFTNTEKSDKMVKSCTDCSGGECAGESVTVTVNDYNPTNPAEPDPVIEPDPDHPEYTCSSDSDCGKDQWVGDSYCKNGNAYQAYRTYICNSPGTNDAYCTYNEKSKFVEDCEDDCENGACATLLIIATYTCYQDSDCGTDGWLGQEYCCSGAGENHDLCDTWRTYTCNNPGTPSAYCTHTDEDKIKQNCGDTSYGSWSNPYCSDDDVYHSRSVTYRGCDVGGCYQSTGVEEEKLEECGAEGCTNGQCNTGTIECHTNSDCGTDGWLGNEYCTSGGGENTDIADTWREYTCHYPGTPSAYCTNSDKDKIKEDCGDSSCDDWGNPYCYDNDVWHSRECNSRGCWGGPSCYDGQYTDDEKLQECGADGCTNGQCNTGTIECHTNSDCGTNKWVGSPYCNNGDVWQAWRTYTCNSPGTTSSYCSNADQNKKKEDCANGCTNGQCNSGSIECYNDGDCPSDTWIGNPYCKNSDVYQEWRDHSCQDPGTTNSDCVYSDSEKKKQDCGSNGCSGGKCNSGSLPDLKVSDLIVMWPPDPKVGDLVSFEFKVKNIGDADADNVKVSLSTGSYTWNPSYPIKLDVGNEIYVTYDYIYNSSGVYTVTAKADPSNKIHESNENNNKMSISLGVSPFNSAGAGFHPIEIFM